MKVLVSKLYKISPIRWSIKLSISMMIVKIFGDLYFYCLYSSGTKNCIPRHTFYSGQQHPFNPPMMMPYPWDLSMEHIEDRRRMEKLIQQMYQIVFMKTLYVERMYKSLPERENPNDVDQYLRYSEVGRIIETLYARALKKMTNSGSVIPDGINQRIRELSQWKYNCKLIEPQL